MENATDTQLFSRRLIGVRNGHGLTQTELAKKVGVSLRSVQHWESGKWVPRGKALRNLAASIDVSVAYLLGEESQQSEPLQGQALVEEERGTGPEQTLRNKCHAHLDQVLDDCHSNHDELAWTYVELKKHFPLRRPQGDPPSSLIDEKATQVLELVEQHVAPAGGTGAASATPRGPAPKERRRRHAPGRTTERTTE